MSLDIPQNADVVVYYSVGKEMPRIIGQWVDEADKWITVRGTVGTQIGKLIKIPISRIITIEWDEQEQKK